MLQENDFYRRQNLSSRCLTINLMGCRAQVQNTKEAVTLVFNSGANTCISDYRRYCSWVSLNFFLLLDLFISFLNLNGIPISLKSMCTVFLSNIFQKSFLDRKKIICIIQITAFSFLPLMKFIQRSLNFFIVVHRYVSRLKQTMIVISLCLPTAIKHKMNISNVL